MGSGLWLESQQRSVHVARNRLAVCRRSGVEDQADIRYQLIPGLGVDLQKTGVGQLEVQAHARTEQLGQLPYKLIELHLGREWEGVSFPEVACPSIFALESEEFWPALRVLEHCHVVEWAVYTTNGKPVREYDYGRPAKPVGVVRNGRLQTQAPESKPGLLAYMIGCVHLDGFTDTAEVVRDWGESNALMAIENASVRHIEGVGILRMTHRADTDNAKAWCRQINEESRKAVFFYETVAKVAGCEVPDMEGENRIEAAFA